MPKKKATTTTAATTIFKIGDRVKLKAGVKPIEVNDFDRYPQPYYFDSKDVATVFGVDSPRLRHKPGLINTQTVVRFEKIGFKGILAQLVARVETSDLELLS